MSAFCFEKTSAFRFNTALRYSNSLCDFLHFRYSMSGMTGLFFANSLSVCHAGKFEQLDCLSSVSDFMVNTFFKDFIFFKDFRFNVTFRSKKTGVSAWLIRILLTGFFSYFLSGSLIRINPSLRSILTSKLHTRSLPRLNWSDLSRFLTNKGVLPAT